MREKREGLKKKERETERDRERQREREMRGRKAKEVIDENLESQTRRMMGHPAHHTHTHTHTIKQTHK